MKTITEMKDITKEERYTNDNKQTSNKSVTCQKNNLHFVTLHGTPDILNVKNYLKKTLNYYWIRPIEDPKEKISQYLIYLATGLPKTKTEFQSIIFDFSKNYYIRF